jgi:hypothetical protein
MPASKYFALALDLGGRLFDTVSAAEWLTEHGVRRSPNTLRKLRCTGGGPAYRTLNGKPYYTEGDLADWIRSRLSGPIQSTSEADVANLRRDPYSRVDSLRRGIAEQERPADKPRPARRRPGRPRRVV